MDGRNTISGMRDEKSPCPFAPKNSVDCDNYKTEICRKCGWYPNVGEKRLKKMFTAEEIEKLRSIKITKVG